MSILTPFFNLFKLQKPDDYSFEQFNDNMDIIDTELHKPPLTINSIQPNPTTRNLQLDVVPLADNLTSDEAQLNIGTFIQRTSGGESSVANGEASLMSIQGNQVKTGYIAEVLGLSVNPVPRDNPITATIDRETFFSAVSAASGTVTLTYTTGWSTAPETYGITVTGTAVEGDIITVNYVKENRGLITVATPTSFVSTGWNLYNHSVGYAKVIDYSQEYGFMIEGTYTALQYSETLNGEKSTITPVDGYFIVPGDGFIWVTGGNSTDTAIWMTWSDWTDDPNGGTFEAYSQSVVDLSGVMVNFPNGLMRIGTVYDEINLNTQLAYSRIERLAYTSENLANVIDAGVPYDTDTNYIYAVRELPVSYSINLSGDFDVNDHGEEYFVGTSIPVTVSILYGQDLKNKLRRDVVTISQQTLTAAQKQQIQENIGVLADLLKLNTYEFSGTLENGKDLNNVGTPGHYLLANSYTYQNAPPDAAFLIVERSSTNATTIFQICYGTNMCAFRFRTGATSWTYWTPVCLEAKNGSYSLGGCMANGYVSNTNVTDMYLEVPLYRKLPMGKTVSLSSLKMEVRGNQGYVDIFTFENGDIEKKGISGYTYTLSRTSAGNLYISLTKASGLTNVTNNTPVIARIRSITFTLS